MKTKAKQLTTYANLRLVQVQAHPETKFIYKPGAPEMKNGGLIITESTGEGIVGKLAAENKTSSFLLLTDADVLIGAKQNRIINKSILLDPMTKTVIDVSCVERLRWQYTSRNFSSHGTVADHDLRKLKAASIAFKKTRPDEFSESTQSTVWNHVSNKLREQGLEEKTESYAELIDYSMSKGEHEFPVCEAEKGCNGIAVVLDGKVTCIDIFGTEEVYRYYFRNLRDSAFRMAKKGKDIRETDINEAYFKVLDTLDYYETTVRHPDPSYNGAGLFSMADNDRLIAFDLSMDREMIHTALFIK